MFLLLRNKKLSVVIKQSVEALQYLSFGQVELIQNQPVALPHCLHQWPLSEHQPSTLVREVVADVLFNLRMFMVVDPNAAVPRLHSHVPNHACFAS